MDRRGRTVLGSLTEPPPWVGEADGPLPWVLKHEGRQKGDWASKPVAPMPTIFAM